MAEGKLGNFILSIGLIFIGASTVYTGVAYLLGGAGVPAFLVAAAVGIALVIAGVLLARHYL